MLGVQRKSVENAGESVVSHKETVRPEGAEHQWREVPARELSVDLVADERRGWVTGRLNAS